MSERFRASPDHYFISREPAPKVRDFITENPNPTFKLRVDFLRSEFPQRTGRNINWIMEGGTAVAILCPHLGREIKDLDIITLTKSMADEFTGTWPYFHARWVNDWLEKRKFKVTPKNISYVLRGNVPLHVEGGELLTMAPAILAASKLYLYDKLPPRPQDLIDVASLGVPKQKALGVIQRLAV